MTSLTYCVKRTLWDWEFPHCGLRIYIWLVTLSSRVTGSSIPCHIVKQPSTLADEGGTILWNKISNPGNQCVTIQKTWILNTNVHLLYSKSLPVYPLKRCTFPQAISLKWIWKLPSVMKYRYFPTHDQVPFWQSGHRLTLYIKNTLHITHSLSTALTHYSNT